MAQSLIGQILLPEWGKTGDHWIDAKSPTVARFVPWRPSGASSCVFREMDTARKATPASYPSSLGVSEKAR